MISVCMATFNGEKYIKQQMDSILCQLSKDYEVIVSDDGSKDKTIQILEAYDDPRIKIFINHGPHGYTKNFENALKKCRGDIIFLSDQDDVWKKNKVDVSLEQLKDAELIVHDAKLIDGDGNSLGHNFSEYKHHHTGFLWNLLTSRFLGCCLVFRRNILDECLPFPDDIISHDYWIGMYSVAIHKVKFVPEVLMYYRRHGNNASTVTQKSPYSFWFKIYNKRFKVCIDIIKRWKSVK